ncbi:MAG: squalene/phytoene synthase family protein [Gammaproteobacteria bacterium]
MPIVNANLDRQAYCREQVAVPGSSYYYSTLFLTPDQQSRLHPLFAFRREILDIPSHCSDPGVARLKLQWWCEALLRSVRDGSGEHPIAAELGMLLHTRGLGLEPLLAALLAVEAEIGPGEYPRYADLVAHCRQGYGPFWHLAARLSGSEREDALAAITELGARIELADRLTRLGELARRGRLLLPLELLAAHGLHAAQVLVRPAPPALGTVIRGVIDLLETDLTLALQSVPAADCARQLNALVLGRIHLATLAEIKRSGDVPLHHALSLTPLRKLWIAWRCYRLAKGA